MVGLADANPLKVLNRRTLEAVCMCSMVSIQLSVSRRSSKAYGLSLSGGGGGVK